MIPVRPVEEPEDFEAKCGKPGRAWLVKNPDCKRPKDFWSPFKHHLADGFENRCGYGAMLSSSGTVDHYLSWTNHPELAYSWANYRFVEAWINQSKRAVDESVLDPYEVGEGWFEISLPSLQLVVTERVPAEHRARAEYTLLRLHLRDDERIVRQRRAWLKLYEEDQLSLDGLALVAPLIAAAVSKRDSEASRPRQGRPAGRPSISPQKSNATVS